ncbi:MAG: potassium channel protein [Bdellovibrionales bacterium]|nr:potassium channel protein [Bdellovibrionales bacterium]
MMKMVRSSDKLIRRERWGLLVRMNRLLSIPMSVLAVIWLILTVLELTKGLAPALMKVVTAIWIIFWLNFTIEFLIAPSKRTYLKHNWLTALSLILPALRIFRLFRVLKYASFIRGSYLIRILSSVNRSMSALRRSLGKRGIHYVVGVTIIVICAGAAGILAFERDQTEYFSDYGVALWWTAMMITTMGTDYFPKSSEGRFLAVLLAVYGFAIFGYVTATVAKFFIDTDNLTKNHEDLRLESLQKEIQELKELLLARNK